MADDPQEGQSETPVTPPPEEKKAEIPAEEKSLLPESDSELSIKEEKQMEVHHHSHSHGKKNWKTYFFEFFMLFFAVFCGFLAEYYLEHKIEKERGKQFIESLYTDLKSDTVRIEDFTNFDEAKMTALSNLETCYDTVIKNYQNANCLLPVIKQTAINRPFIRTDRTLIQLVNSGGYRLLNQQDADSIISYDQMYSNFQDFQQTVYQQSQDNVRNTLNAIGNFKANVRMFIPIPGKRISTDSFNGVDFEGPVLFNSDKDQINRYFNELQLYYRITFNHRRMLIELKEKQMSLVKYLQEKYNFK